MLELGVVELTDRLRQREIGAAELVEAYLRRIEHVNPKLNAAVQVLSANIDESGNDQPLRGLPFSVKDSIDVAGTRSTAGTLGRKNAPLATNNATLVERLRKAGAIPIAKTNLPDLLFSFETDNLIYGATNNPYDLSRSAGGSSGGEAALIAACGSPFGLWSDAFGSVRLPAAFCGIAALKPTSGRLPRTGHVPPPGGWLEAVWQIGPIAKYARDLEFMLPLLAYPDTADIGCYPVPLDKPKPVKSLKVAYFASNGFVSVTPPVAAVVHSAAEYLGSLGATVVEVKPPGVEAAFELEMAIAGADGGAGIDSYLVAAGSSEVHRFHKHFVGFVRRYGGSAADLAGTWTRWDDYRQRINAFFAEYDAVLCPVYPDIALKHGGSQEQKAFEGFSYTMAWNMAGTPAATVRCGTAQGLPVNVQVISGRWRDMQTLAICRELESRFGGWLPPPET